MLALVSMTHSITTLPAEFLTAIEILSLCTSMPIYLVLIIRAPSSGAVERALKPYSKQGAPFILRRETVQVGTGTHLSANPGGLNGSTQHSAQTPITLKTRAKSARQVRS